MVTDPLRRSPPHENARMASEPTLSSLAWLAASTVLQRVSPAVLEMPSVGGRKTKEQGGGAQAQGGGKAVVFRAQQDRCVPSVCLYVPSLSNSQIDLIPRENAQACLEHLFPMTSTLPFRSLGSQDLSSGTRQRASASSRCTGRTLQSASSTSERWQKRGC